MKLSPTRLRRDVALGVKNLLLHKLRSALTMLGMVFGVGSVIAMLAIGEGASAEALERIRRLGSQNILLEAQPPPKEQLSKTRNEIAALRTLLLNDRN